ncbi:MAG: hypothetical protein DBY37_06750 [Desulfovibrionaceae bacterium]|nr:MAG: hypothetical protein DBY37_06750 [Desulfovibrionaceae bacterium]
MVPFRPRGGMRCRRDSPCSTRAGASCIHGRPVCAFVRLRRSKAPLRGMFDRDLLMSRVCLAVPAPACALRGKRRAPRPVAPVPPAAGESFGAILQRSRKTPSLDRGGYFH